jgi:hypothetical protein
VLPHRQDSFPIVPISFEWKGRIYSGKLSPVNGAGGSGGIWYFTINDQFVGQLGISATGGGSWAPYDPTLFADLGDFFVDYITAYLDGPGPDAASPEASE